VFCSCLPIGHDWGVGGEVERFGLERGGLGELLEGAGVAVQAGGVPGLGGELGEQRAVAVRGCPVLVRFVCAFCCALLDRTLRDRVRVTGRCSSVNSNGFHAAFRCQVR